MTKHEFMARLTSELRKRNVADAADVTQEYEQHFAFKLADGYSEEEIAAKLGSPEELAAQFECTNTAKKVGGSKALAVTGLCFAALAICLLGGWNIAGPIPAMPYWCGAILALSFAALTVLLVVGCVYYAAFLRQLGYCDLSEEGAIACLAGRLAARGGFPHEIGLFLGYPLCDVQGFIRHAGRHCKCCGYWKVYGDEAEAQSLFQKFDRCREAYRRMFRRGCSLEQLTVAAGARQHGL